MFIKEFLRPSIKKISVTLVLFTLIGIALVFLLGGSLFGLPLPFYDSVLTNPPIIISILLLVVDLLVFYLATCGIFAFLKRIEWQWPRWRGAVFIGILALLLTIIICPVFVLLHLPFFTFMNIFSVGGCDASGYCPSQGVFWICNWPLTFFVSIILAFGLYLLLRRKLPRIS